MGPICWLLLGVFIAIACMLLWRPLRFLAAYVTLAVGMAGPLLLFAVGLWVLSLPDRLFGRRSL